MKFLNNILAQAGLIVSGTTNLNGSSTAVTVATNDNSTNIATTAFVKNNGYLTGISSANVTTALGYTPYNSTNPSGYITGINSSMVTAALGYTPLSGSGTTGYLAKWDNGALTNSLICDNASAIGINTASPFSSPSFKLDINGGVLIKNASGVSAQLVLINSDPAAGGNNGFVQLLAGGNTSTAYGQWQTYYGASIASGTLIMQALGGTVLVGSNTAVTGGGVLQVSGDVNISGSFKVNGVAFSGGGISSFNTRTGAITLTSGDVTGALGYTPYNNSNPSGYITSSGNISGYAMSLNGYSNQSIHTILTGPANGPVWKVRYDSATANRYVDLGFQDGNGVYSEGLKIYNGSALTWLGSAVWTAGSLTNLSQLSNGPGYITSSALSSYLPLSGGVMAGSIAMGGNNITNIGQLSHTNGRIIMSGNLHIDAFNGNAIYLQYYNQGVTTQVYGAIAMNGYNITGAPNLITTSNYSSYALPLSGGTLSGGITFTASGGSVLLKHAVSEVDAWIFQENAANWGLYWKNAPSGNHTFGGYTTVGAELVGMSASNASGNGVLTSNFVGASSAYAQWMLSNYTGYIWSASTIYAAGDMRAPIYYDSNDTSYYLDPNSTSRLRKVFIQHSSGNSDAGPALRVSKGWDNGTPNYAYDTVVIEANDVTSIRMKEADGGTAGWSTGDGHTSFTSSTDLRFYVGGATDGYVYSGMGGTQRLRISTDTYGVSAYSHLHMNYNNVDYVNQIYLETGGQGAYLQGNNSGSYGSLRVNGTRNGWYGIYFDSGNTLMMNSGESGFYRINYGWQFRWYNGVGYINTGSLGGGSEYTILHSGNYSSWAASRRGEGSNYVDYSRYVYNNGAYSGSGWIEPSDLGVRYANSSNRSNFLDTQYVGGVQTNPQVYFNNGIGLKVAMTGAWSTWSDTIWVNGYSGGDVPWMCALHFLRNSQPRMAISAQTHGSGSYGSYYEVITTWNIGSQSVSYASSAGSASNITAYTINQNLGTGNYVSFYNLTLSTSGTASDWYANGWFRNNSQNCGLYSQVNGTHFYSSGSGDWNITGSGGTIALVFRSNHQSTIRGYVYADTSNQIGFLNSGGSWSLRMDNSGNLTATGDVTAYSDSRVKENIVTVDNALSKVLSLRGVYYNRIDTDDRKRKIGVIAQETLSVIPEVVNNDDKGMYNVAYGNLGGLFIEAFKEHDKTIKEQAEQIKELKSIINVLTR